jgi:hypothetical protein
VDILQMLEIRGGSAVVNIQDGPADVIFKWSLTGCALAA